MFSYVSPKPVIIVVILRTFFVSSAPRVPVEEAVSRKILGMREVAPAAGTERETACCFATCWQIRLHQPHVCHFYVSLCKTVCLLSP